MLYKKKTILYFGGDTALQRLGNAFWEQLYNPGGSCFNVGSLWADRVCGCPQLPPAASKCPQMPPAAHTPHELCAASDSQQQQKATSNNTPSSPSALCSHFYLLHCTDSAFLYSLMSAGYNAIFCVHVLPLFLIRCFCCPPSSLRFYCCQRVSLALVNVHG